MCRPAAWLLTGRSEEVMAACTRTGSLAIWLLTAVRRSRSRTRALERSRGSSTPSGPRVEADLGAGRRGLHPPRDPRAARGGGRRPGACSLRARPPWRPGGAARTGQGAGQHGDRPQRHARPVGLDARPRDPLVANGSGTRPPRRRPGSARTTSSTTRTRTSSAGTATSATRRCASPPSSHGTRSTWPSPSTRSLMAAVFEWAIAIYDMELDAVRRGEKPRADGQARVRRRSPTRRAPVSEGLRRSSRCCPAARRAARSLATVAANVVRNFWLQTIVFCGHLPDGREHLLRGAVRGESRGRAGTCASCSGSCNLDGGRLFHLMTGQPVLPDRAPSVPGHPEQPLRQIAPRVRAVCERYGLPYTSGRLGRQYRSGRPQDRAPPRRTRRRSAPAAGPAGAVERRPAVTPRIR